MLKGATLEPKQHGFWCEALALENSTGLGVVCNLCLSPDQHDILRQLWVGPLQSARHHQHALDRTHAKVVVVLRRYRNKKAWRRVVSAANLGKFTRDNLKRQEKVNVLAVTLRHIELMMAMVSRAGKKM